MSVVSTCRVSAAPWKFIGVGTSAGQRSMQTLIIIRGDRDYYRGVGIALVALLAFREAMGRCAHGNDEHVIRASDLQ